MMQFVLVAVSMLALINSHWTSQSMKEYMENEKDKWVALGVMCEEDREKYFNIWWTENYEDQTELELFYSKLDQDTNVMLWRLEQTTEKTPPFGDIHFLPTAERARYGVDISYAYIKWCKYIRNWANSTEQLKIDNVIEDTKKRQNIYQLMYEIHYNWNDRGRRLLLEDLKKLVGEDNYRLCKYPPPLPPIGYTDSWPLRKMGYYGYLLIEYEE
jgi:hypothetical protein